MNQPASNLAPDSSEVEEQQPPRDEWDELAELAAMTGFKTNAPTSEVKTEANQQAKGSAEDAPLLDEADLQAASAKTQVPLWRKPSARLGFVATLAGLGVGGVGLFYYFSGNTLNTSFNAPTPLPIQPDAAAKPDAAQTEIGRLKTINALGSQAQTLKQTPSGAKPISVPAKPGETPKPASSPAPEKPSIEPPPSFPTTQSAPVTTYTPPEPPTYSAPAQSFTPPAPIAVQSSSPIASVESNPTEAWEKAVTVGSFSSNSSTVSQTPTEPQAQEASDRSKALTKPTDQDRYEADAAALLSGQPRHTATIVPGTTATATLTTPIVWAQDLKPDQQPQRFGLQLSQPLYAADGSVALPAGTQMVAKVDAVSESGMVQLSVVTVVAPTATGNQVVEIPSSSLLISGEKGNPLVAELQNPGRRGNFGRDMTTALLGGLGQVGTLLNRPANQTTVTSPYLSSTSIGNSQTNILGGVLQGAFSPLLEQTQKRHQQEIEAVLKRPNLWYIPAGKPILIFTNSSVEVDR